MSNLPSVKHYIQVEETRFRSAVSESMSQNMGTAINYLNDFTDTIYTDLGNLQADFTALVNSNDCAIFSTLTRIEYGTGTRNLISFTVDMSANDVMFLSFGGVGSVGNFSSKLGGLFSFESSAAACTHNLSFIRNGSTLLSETVSLGTVSLGSTFNYFDRVSTAGSYTYTLTSTTTDPGFSFNHIEAGSYAMMFKAKA